jgi:transcriptional regulator GlxA family with amidase domain
MLLNPQASGRAGSAKGIEVCLHLITRDFGDSIADIMTAESAHQSHKGKA